MVLDDFHFSLQSPCFLPLLSPFFHLIVLSKDLERKLKITYKAGTKICIGFTPVRILSAISNI